MSRDALEMLCWVTLHATLSCLGFLSNSTGVRCAGISLDQELHKTLLYLCSGGENWDAKVRSAAPAGAQTCVQPAAEEGAAPCSSGVTAAADGAAERRAANGQATTSCRGQQGDTQEQEGAQPARQLSEEEWVYAAKRGRDIWDALCAKGVASSEVLCYRRCT